ncbi:hypothetical protein SBRCBS47491_010109 [Sporothrix bragantina]|uniref:Aminoglycoside phosphotransferase domain-containing protein n=1 Tax=Sporothrix bragantina TaxID=671064 RepID=A0ABP0D000_9PEZI
MFDTATLNWKERTYDPDASMGKAMRQTDWPALCQLASGLRNGVRCEPLGHANNGLENMARLLRFEDGVLWVARVAMRTSAADLVKVRSEQSSLLVPEAFASECEIGQHNAVGAPFVLMSFVPGNTAMDAGGGFEKHRDGILAAAEDWHYTKNTEGTFKSGLIPGIGGPFETATDFYKAWVNHVRFPRQPNEILDIMRGAPEAEQVLLAVEQFPNRFHTVAPQFTHKSSRDHDHGPFPQCHPNFLHSNIIVASDTDYHVLGIIDWEFDCTLPVELVRFPRFLDLMPRHCGRNNRFGASGMPCDEEERQTWHERHEYVQMVAALEL